jgi:hypothetical protein
MTYDINYPNCNKAIFLCHCEEVFDRGNLENGLETRLLLPPRRDRNDNQKQVGILSKAPLPPYFRKRIKKHTKSSTDPATP